AAQGIQCRAGGGERALARPGYVSRGARRESGAALLSFHRTIMAEQRWISETLFDELGLRTAYAVERVLYETRTDHQHLVLFEHRHFGKVLMLDGATQVTTRDEFIYHEMMSHVPLLAHGKAREVLIVGGGDCGIAEEVLKHAGVARLTQVEIDQSVV